MLLDIAIADAYGAGFEFAKAKLLSERSNDFSGYYEHSLDQNLAGMYTDDTQMSIGLAEWMLAHNEQDFETLPLESFAESFVNCFKRDERKTYSKRMYNFLKANQSAKEFMKNVQPLSTRSGAAMRCCLLGLLESKEMVLTVARRQAQISHNTVEGIASAQAVALTSWMKAQGYNEKQIGQALAEEVPQFDWLVKQEHPVSYEGVDCARAAINACLDESINKDHKLMLKTIVSWGGDTDTVAAIAIGIQSITGHLEWPTWALAGLENGAYGKDYLIEMDARLSARWHKNKAY